MSRFTQTLGDKTLIYGLDHALGYFYEVWDNEDLELLNKCDEHTEVYPEALIDKDQLFNDLDELELVDVLTQFGADRNHIFAVGNCLAI